MKSVKSEYLGYRMLNVETKMGHRCGYVKIPSSHPLFGVLHNVAMGWSKDRTRKWAEKTALGDRGLIPLFCWDNETMKPEIYFDIHGGITFSGDAFKDGGFCYGFDCAHDDDTPETCDVDFVDKSCKRLVDQLIEFAELEDNDV